ncbi:MULTISPECIES: flippase [unclassified Variovorax]|uniref:flippase n=1 Tax=unclassified Variovorax TaxID=663243 RepID=UPI002576858A|nr:MULTISPECIES: flippase [unclassified Variovorax]MDM0090581.1 flippase [Variovorax sp. J22G40]MDM0147754.1 flippase [Variovorax sp. J2P1-31]
MGVRAVLYSLSEYSKNRPGLRLVLGNIGWLFFEKIFRMIGGLVIGVWIARHLGPDNFGKLNYATAFAGLFSVIATLGLNSIVVRDLINFQNDKDEILGTAFALQVISGIFSLLLMVAAIHFVRPDDTLGIWMVMIIGGGQVLRAGDVIRYWFEARSTLRNSVLVDNGAFILTSILKILLLLSDANLLAFVWVGLVESALMTLGLFSIYGRSGSSFRSWTWTIKQAKKLLHASWPLILSGLAVTVYMRIDQIMLGQIVGDEAVGVFSAATRLSEVFYFIPIVISAAVFPSIIKAKKIGEKEFLDRLQKFFNALTIVAISIALPLSLLSKQIVSAFYGAEYSDASAIFGIHIWACVFVFLGVSGSRWFLAENLQRLSFYRTLAGAVLNVALNFVLIPRFGALGAAVATVISQAMACFFFNAFIKRTRVLFWMQCKSLVSFLPPWQSRWRH